MKTNRGSKIRGKFFWAVLLIFFNFICIPSLCASSINVNQSKVRLSVKPGGSASGAIEVQNSSATDIIVRAYLEDWMYSKAGDGTKDFYPAGTMPRSAAQWISFVPSEFIVPANSSQRVNYTVKVPADATGTAFAVLFFESTVGRQTPKDTVGMNLVLRVGSLFYVEVAGAAKREAAVSDFALSSSGQGQPSQITLNLKNTGTSDITTDSQFDIMDDKGMVYDRGKFNPTYTLPGDSAVLRAETKQKLKPGTYSLVITIDLGKAQKDLGLGEGPVIVKETLVSVSADGTMAQKGALK